MHRTHAGVRSILVMVSLQWCAYKNYVHFKFNAKLTCRKITKNFKFILVLEKWY
jgi:hypothetical protein